MSNISGAGGNQVISVAKGDNITVDNFGGFGTGATASNPGELDTLKFLSNGMSAPYMLLNQVGTDVVITFENVANTSVTLTNTTIDQLENITHQGNFMFAGQGSPVEAIDVLSNPTLTTVQHNNVTTYLTDGTYNFAGAAGNDTIRASGGNDELFGAGGNDKLFGGAGDDYLSGGAGNDTLNGGAGNDEYIVDSASDVVVETLTAAQGGGIDVVVSTVSYTLSANVDNLEVKGPSGGTGVLSGTGNEIDNIISGDPFFLGTYILDGKGGNDQVEGNGTLYGGEGNDWLLGNGELHGDAGNDELTVLSGNNTLDGGTGADIMHGAFGNDTYYVNNVKDVVDEGSGGGAGIDTVISSISYTLTAGVENLNLTGTAGLTGNGNDLNNTIIGSNGNDKLNGGAGNDTLQGGAGTNDLRPAALETTPITSRLPAI